MTTERVGFEHCWAVRSADDEGNLGAKPLRSEADPQNYRGSAVQGSWVWFQRGAAWQRAQMGEWIPVSERLPADSRDVLVYCSDTDEHMVGSSMGCGRFAFAFSERGTRICCKPSHWRYIDECDKPAALAASTGQEVEK